MKLSALLIILFGNIVLQDSKWKSIDLIPSAYRIDGSISGREILDTTQMQTVATSKRFIIKKSSDFTYISIRSNTSTILNAYIISENKIKVLHASAALGQVDYIKEEDAYKSTKEQFDWIYRDPVAWGDEMHPEGVKTREEFYEKYGWMANTWYMGSYREFEMIIDNAHFEDDSRLMFSFTSEENDQKAIRMMEGSITASLTGNETTDNQLHRGNLPSSIIIKPD